MKKNYERELKATASNSGNYDFFLIFFCFFFWCIFFSLCIDEELQRSWAEKLCFGCTCLQLFWPRVVMRKWLNISAKDSDYSADPDSDVGSDSGSDSDQG